MLKKPASFVLAAAGLLDSAFEHPAGCAPVIPNVPNYETLTCTQSFSVACQWEGVERKTSRMTLETDAMAGGTRGKKGSRASKLLPLRYRTKRA